MYLVLSRDMDNVVIHVQFPATLEEVRRDISRLDEHSAGTGPVRIIDTSSCAKNLTGYIKRADLDSETDIKKLSQLAKQIDSMGEQEQRIFSGALDAESISGLDDVLRIVSNLEQYEFIEGVSSDKELGGWLVEHGQAGVDFPETVRPYLDYAGIGAEYYASHGGAYTPHGYVKRRETSQEQAVAEKSKFALTLMSISDTYRLSLPTSDDELERARQALKVKSLGEVIFSGIKIDYPWEHLVPLDGVTLDDADVFAQYIQQMSESELKVFGAALEAEEPSTFSDAMRIAEDIVEYELVDCTEGEYGRQALRYAGAGDEILDMLDGFTDFDALGRCDGVPGETQRSGFAGERSRSEMSEPCPQGRTNDMELAATKQDGVRETSFGSIKRLSSPFPQQMEQGQTMY